MEEMQLNTKPEKIVAPSLQNTKKIFKFTINSDTKHPAQPANTPSTGHHKINKECLENRKEMNREKSASMLYRKDTTIT